MQKQKKHSCRNTFISLKRACSKLAIRISESLKKRMQAFKEIPTWARSTHCACLKMSPAGAENCHNPLNGQDTEGMTLCALHNIHIIKNLTAKQLAKKIPLPCGCRNVSLKYLIHDYSCATCGEEYWFSFCWNDSVQDTFCWHCAVCRTCRDKEEWHCNQCNRCTYGIDLPCENCSSWDEQRHSKKISDGTVLQPFVEE